jgi:hypothetical protein
LSQRKPDDVNPTTGEDLHFNEENIKNCVAHKSIKKFAYIKHDKDVCTKEDEVNGRKIGDVSQTTKTRMFIIM